MTQLQKLSWLCSSFLFPFHRRLSLGLGFAFSVLKAGLDSSNSSSRNSADLRLLKQLLSAEKAILPSLTPSNMVRKGFLQENWLVLRKLFQARALIFCI